MSMPIAETLIKQAILDEADKGIFGYGYRQSSLESIRGKEYVVLRAKTKYTRNPPFTIFAVNKGATAKLDLGEWPLPLLVEYEGLVLRK